MQYIKNNVPNALLVLWMYFCFTSIATIGLGGAQWHRFMFSEYHNELLSSWKIFIFTIVFIVILKQITTPLWFRIFMFVISFFALFDIAATYIW